MTSTGQGHNYLVRRTLSIPLLCLALLSCEEPPPPVAVHVLNRVTAEFATVTLGSRSADVLVAKVPRGFYDNTAQPVLGRTFVEEDFSGSPSVCIISYSLWERFGSGESDAPLVVGGSPLRVVGVMPEGFRIPDGAQVWIATALPGGRPWDPQTDTRAKEHKYSYMFCRFGTLEEALLC